MNDFRNSQADDVSTASLVKIPHVRVLEDYAPLTSIVSDTALLQTVLLSMPEERFKIPTLLHGENASALHAAQIAAISPQMVPRHQISDAGDSGLGLFATAHIDRGELVLHERPLIVYPQLIPFYSSRPDGQQYPELEHAVEHMSPDKREVFFALMNAHPDESSPIKGIIDTNALFVGTLLGGPHLYAAVCEQISRINHSCSPNAAYRFDRDTWAFEVRALFPILPGEQVSIAYINPALPRDIRQQALSSYGFTCNCSACALTGTALALSEARRRLIAQADADEPTRDAALARWARTPPVGDEDEKVPTTTVDAMYMGVFEAERLYYEPVWEGYVGRLCRAACALEDGEDARAWAGLAAKICRAYTGSARGWDAVAAAPDRTDWWGIRRGKLRP